MSNKFYDRLQFVLHFKFARDTFVLRKGRARCKYVYGFHGYARFATATVRLAQDSSTLVAWVTYFVRERPYESVRARTMSLKFMRIERHPHDTLTDTLRSTYTFPRNLKIVWNLTNLNGTNNCTI